MMGTPWTYPRLHHIFIWTFGMPVTYSDALCLMLGTHSLTSLVE